MTRLELVGILTLLAFCHCRAEHHVVARGYASSGSGVGDCNNPVQYSSQSALPPINGNFWWDNPKSPFAAAFEFFKKCSATGNCVPSAVIPGLPAPAGHDIFNIDISKNPFLSGGNAGNFQGVAVSSCSGTACKDGKPQTVITSCAGKECKTQQVTGDSTINITGNPFLNGGINFGGATSIPPSGPGCGSGGRCSQPNFQSFSVASCSGVACKDGTDKTVVTACKGKECKTQQLAGGQSFDFSTNPFLSGSGNAIAGAVGTGTSSTSGASSGTGGYQGGFAFSQGGANAINGAGCSGNECDIVGGGNLQTIAVSSCSGIACKDGKDKTVITACEGANCKTQQVAGGQQIDISKNPFLNGNVPASGKISGSFYQTAGFSSSCSTATGCGVTSSPTLNLIQSPSSSGKAVTQSAISNNGVAVTTGSDGFLGVQPGVPFGNRPKPFSTIYPGKVSGSISVSAAGGGIAVAGGGVPINPFFGGENEGQACSGIGYICVAISACENGVVKSSVKDTIQVKNDVQYCRQSVEICCRLPEISNLVTSVGSVSGSYEGFGRKPSSSTSGSDNVPAVGTQSFGFGIGSSGPSAPSYTSGSPSESSATSPRPGVPSSGPSSPFGPSVPSFGSGTRTSVPGAPPSGFGSRLSGPGATSPGATVPSSGPGASSSGPGTPLSGSSSPFGPSIPSSKPATATSGVGRPSPGPGAPLISQDVPAYRPGGPSSAPGASLSGPGVPSFGPSSPSFGPGAPSFGPGAPSFGPDVPSFGPGVPSTGPGAPSVGPGAPSSGPGAPSSVPVALSTGPGEPSSGPGAPLQGPGVPSSGPGIPSSGPGVHTSQPGILTSSVPAQSGSDSPSFVSSTPSLAPSTPSFGPGAPSVSGSFSFGSGTSSSGPGVPSLRPGAPSSGLGVFASEPGAPKSRPSSGSGAPFSGPGAPSSGPGVPSSGPGAPSYRPGVPSPFGSGAPTTGPGVTPSGSDSPYPSSTRTSGKPSPFKPSSSSPTSGLSTAYNLFTPASNRGPFSPSGSPSGSPSRPTFGPGESSPSNGKPSAPSGPSNLSSFAQNKESLPVSKITYQGGIGLSPGSIVVVTDDQPNPEVVSPGQVGSTPRPSSKNTSPSSNSIFPKTIDYSNDKLNNLQFASTIKGPAYLPPNASPTPPIATVDLEAPEIRTFKPIGSTVRPFLTSPPTPFSRQPLTSQPPYVSQSSVIPTRPQQFTFITGSTTTTQGPLLPDSSQTGTPYYQPRPTSTPQKVSYQTPYQPVQSSLGYRASTVSHITTPRPGYRPGTVPVQQQTFTSPRPDYQQTNTVPTPKSGSYRPGTTRGYQPIPTTPRPIYELPSQQPGTVLDYQSTFPTSRPFSQPSPQSTSRFQYSTPNYEQSSPYRTTGPGYQPRPTTTGSDYKQTPEGRVPNYQTTSQGPSSRPGLYLPPKSLNTQTPPPISFVPTIRPPNGGPPDLYEGPSNEGVPYYKPPPEQQRPPHGPATSIPNIRGSPSPPPPTPPRRTSYSNGTEIYAETGPGVPVVPVSGCAAALQCVQETYCTADGFISSTPVVLSKDQLLTRVPLQECYDISTKAYGKCCRDRNYVDAWPSANLINGVDDGQYKEDDSIGQYRAGSEIQYRSDGGQYQTKGSQRQRPTRGSSNRGSVKYESRNDTFNTPTCGTRNRNSKPRGTNPLEAAFAEFPWQAMILRDSTRTLLCGGVIIRPDVVLTTAHCVDGIDTKDVLIKGGEWKLGIDEEPLPFQIVPVAVIVRHSDYRPGSLVNDLAVLILKEKLRLTKNINTLCLPELNKIPTRDCVVTGWGKQILQVHLRGAIMNHIPVNVLQQDKCEAVIKQSFPEFVSNYSPNTLCGISDNDQCSVDYGSALACVNEQGRYTLSGVFSWDTGCNQETQIGGYVAPDVQWIQSTCSKPLKQLRTLERQYLAQFPNP